MRLFQRKTEHTERDNRPTNVLPGIIATVVDDKKNEVYLDLDLELEPEEPPESRATTLRGHIPPGLVATVNKKNTLKDFDIRRFLQKHLKEVILISCAAFVAVLAAITTYLMYANPVAHQTSYPVVKPLQLLEPVSVSNQPQARNETVRVETRQNPSEKNIKKEYPNHIFVENTSSSVTVQKPTPNLNSSMPQKMGQATNSPTHADTSKTTPTPFEQRFSSPQEVADYYLYAGYLCETRNDLAGALHWYKKAVLVTPNDFRLLNKIAFILIKMSLHDEAAGYAEKALSSQGDYVPALVNMGIIRAHQGNLDEALRFFELALKLDNTNTSALYNLMLLCKKRGDYTRAENIERKLKALGRTEQQ